jgi:hypothetical protein
MEFSIGSELTAYPFEDCCASTVTEAAHETMMPKKRERNADTPKPTLCTCALIDLDPYDIALLDHTDFLGRRRRFCGYAAD